MTPRQQVDSLHRALLSAYVANGGETLTEPTTPEDALNMVVGLMARMKVRTDALDLLQVVTMRADAVAREARLLMARIPDHTDVPTDGMEEALGAYNNRLVPESWKDMQQKMTLMSYREDILSGRPWRAR